MSRCRARSWSLRRTGLLPHGAGACGRIGSLMQHGRGAGEEQHRPASRTDLGAGSLAQDRPPSSSRRRGWARPRRAARVSPRQTRRCPTPPEIDPMQPEIVDQQLGGLRDRQACRSRCRETAKSIIRMGVEGHFLDTEPAGAGGIGVVSSGAGGIGLVIAAGHLGGFTRPSPPLGASANSSATPRLATWD